MAEITQQDVEKFLSKSDFDFSNPAGWREFLNERSAGGAGRDADGYHIRDIKNYAVGTSTIITRGGPVTVNGTIRTLGTGLALPPGVAYFYHPDASWKYVVTSIYVGPPGSSQDFSFEAGGPGKRPGEENWGTIYYIVLKSGEIPGKGAAGAVARRLMRDASRMLNSGRKLLSRGEAGYSITVRVGSMSADTNHFMEQQILSPEGARKMKEFFEGAAKSLGVN
jgi:hypothetical protein